MVFGKLIASTMKLFTKTIAHTGNKHSATVIFFHGSGDTAGNLIEWVRFLLGTNLQFPHIKLVYPTAPLQPYTPLGGEESSVWFDRRSIDPSAKESRKSMAAIYESVGELIDTEVKSGIPLNRIIVGGFSMGGALALHTAYHVQPELRGCFALSAFLNDDSIVYESLRSKSLGRQHADLLMMHGDRDTLVRQDWGRKSFEALQQLDVPGEFLVVKNAMHEMKTRQLLQVKEWINKILPDDDAESLTNKL